MSDNQSFTRRHHGAWWVIGSVLLLAVILGVIVCRNYAYSMKQLDEDLRRTQAIAPRLTLEQCAKHTLKWFEGCQGMSDLCSRSVPRMMKVCIVNGDKAAQCAPYSESLKKPNFGYEACQPYLKDRLKKKACGDVWQTIADFCLAMQTGIEKTSVAPPL